MLYTKQKWRYWTVGAWVCSLLANLDWGWSWNDRFSLFELFLHLSVIVSGYIEQLHFSKKLFSLCTCNVFVMDQDNWMINVQTLSYLIIMTNPFSALLWILFFNQCIVSVFNFSFDVTAVNNNGNVSSRPV